MFKLLTIFLTLLRAMHLEAEWPMPGGNAQQTGFIKGKVEDSLTL